MFDATVVETDTVHQTIHGSRGARLVVETLRLEGEPPLAVERTMLPGGPTRPAVILVHGLAQNRYTWRVTGRSLSGCLAEAGYEVLNLELRGHGLSRSYGAGNARSFDEYVDDLVRVVEACDAPPFVMGHSLGGAVGVGAATRVPLAGLIHLAGVFTFASDNPLLRLLAELSLAAEPLLTLAPVRLSTGWAGDLLGRLYKISDIAGYGFPISGWTPGSIERPLLEERLARGFDWTSVEVWLQMARWARGERLSYAEAFGRSAAPLLVICGDADPLVRLPDSQACYDASGSDDRQLLFFDAFDHEVHWGHVDLILGRRAPDLVWPRIVSWLDVR